MIMMMMTKMMMMMMRMMRMMMMMTMIDAVGGLILLISTWTHAHGGGSLSGGWVGLGVGRGVCLVRSGETGRKAGADSLL